MGEEEGVGCREGRGRDRNKEKKRPRGSSQA